MGTSYHCKYCEQDFEKGRVRKIIRGTPHIFCSESCFVLWRYDRPRMDRDEVYKAFTISVSIPDLDALCDENEGRS